VFLDDYLCTIKNKWAILSLGFFLCISSVIFSVEQKQNKENEKPNIIIILTDDQGCGDMPVHGSLDVHTPPMGRMKSQSVSLECFHGSPTCAPSRA